MTTEDFGQSRVPFTESTTPVNKSSLLGENDRIKWERGSYGEDQMTHLLRQIVVTLADIKEALSQIAASMKGESYQ